MQPPLLSQTECCCGRRGEVHHKGCCCHQGKANRGRAADAWSALGCKCRKECLSVWNEFTTQTAFPIPSEKDEQTYGNVLHGRFSS